MNRVVWTDDELQDIPDSHHTFIPVNCSLKQIAVNHFNGSVSVRKDLWTQLDEVNQAVLIMHELMYEDAILSGQKNSVATRLALSHLIAKSDSVSFFNEIAKDVKRLSDYDVKGYLRFSPLLTVKEMMLKTIVSRNILDDNLKSYLLSFAKTKNFSFVYSVFVPALFPTYGSTDEPRDIKRKRQFLYKYTKVNFNYIKSNTHIGWFKARLAINALVKLKLVDMNFATVIDLLIRDLNSELLNYQDYRDARSFLIQYKHLIDQDILDRLVQSKAFISLELASALPTNLTFSSAYINKAWEGVRKVSEDRYMLPQPYLYPFFLKRGLFENEILQILKKFILNKDSVTSDWNAPYGWFVSEREGFESFYLLADKLKEELKQAAMYEDKHSYKRFHAIEAYYKRFPGPTEPIHVQFVVNKFLDNRENGTNVGLLEWLIKERMEHSDQLQNIVAHSARFPGEGSVYRKKRFAVLLDEFKHFNNLTHSILALELKKHRHETEYIVAILKLYLTREFTSDLRLIFKELTNDPNENIASLALEVLI